jgi:hypothetical protein
MFLFAEHLAGLGCRIAIFKIIMFRPLFSTRSIARSVYRYVIETLRRPSFRLVVNHRLCRFHRLKDIRTSEWEIQLFRGSSMV